MDFCSLDIIHKYYISVLILIVEELFKGKVHYCWQNCFFESRQTLTHSLPLLTLVNKISSPGSLPRSTHTHTHRTLKQEYNDQFFLIKAVLFPFFAAIPKLYMVGTLIFK